jgi:hypothetical protein
LRAAALRYASRGISVVPLHTPSPSGCSCRRGPACASPGKHTRIDWKIYQQRRATVGEILAWWSRWPTANVAIITGIISKLCVVDIDHRNGGFATLVELDHYGGQMPDDNPVAITGSGGLHHYFALDAPLPKAAPFEGIDVQAEGALVVAPPSRHVSGQPYRWARPIESPWPAVPYWLRWACAQVSTTVGAPRSRLADAARDGVLGALAEVGLYLAPHRRPGLHRIRCPWAGEHSNGDPEAVVIEPGACPASGWGFRCLHAHHLERGIGDLLDVLRIRRRRAPV